MDQNKLKITVLSENVAAYPCQAEHGLSYLVEYDEPVLFDTGASDLFLKNASKLNISLDQVEKVVLSHGHFDHGNGIKYLKNKIIITHPEVFAQRFSGRTLRNISVDIDKQQVEKENRLIYSKTPVSITEHIIYLGEIPRLFEFEKNNHRFYFEDRSPDLIIDDSALAVKTHFGLFVVSGCAHAGICNTIEYARKVTGIDNVYGVIGGFHLTEINDQLSETIAFFKKLNIKIVMPSHCTELPALSSLYMQFKGEMVKTGKKYTFPKTEEWFEGKK